MKEGRLERTVEKWRWILVKLCLHKTSKAPSLKRNACCFLFRPIILTMKSVLTAAFLDHISYLLKYSWSRWQLSLTSAQ